MPKLINDNAVDLVSRAVRGAKNHRNIPGPRWAAVMRTFNCGSTRAVALCRWCGLDPDEVMPPVVDLDQKIREAVNEELESLLHAFDNQATHELTRNLIRSRMSEGPEG